MSAFHQLFQTNRVVDVLNQRIRATGGRTTGTIRFNCPMCVEMGTTPDKRSRGGWGFNGISVGINCLNCDFKTRWDTGQPLGRPIKAFMSKLGVSAAEIETLTQWAATLHDMIEEAGEYGQDQLSLRPTFGPRPLPEGARPIRELAEEDCHHPAFLDACRYLLDDRGEAIFDAGDYYWTPLLDHYLNKRVIIPCRFDGQVVGWTSRLIIPPPTPKVPRYYHSKQSNYMFNLDVLDHPTRSTVIIVEGIFDAIAIDGLGVMGSSLSEQQINWINASGKRVIVCPDRDKAGKKLVKIAEDQDWDVSIPYSGYGFENWWRFDIKDCADAVKAYGRLYTLRSIIVNATSDRWKLNFISDRWN